MDDWRSMGMRGNVPTYPVRAPEKEEGQKIRCDQRKWYRSKKNIEMLHVHMMREPLAVALNTVHRP